MSTTIDFSGKVAIITGAARGIGAAAAKAMAEAGASIVLADLLKEVNGTAEEIATKWGSAKAIKTDISRSEDCKAMVAFAIEEYGRLDFAFNNAGTGGESGLLHELSDENWQRVINTNLSGTFYCIKHEIPAMLQSGGGVIINNSSICGQRSVPMFAPYNATKHGVVSLTKQVAAEYGAMGIRSMAIAPGFIDTAMTQKSTNETPGLREALEARIPLGRLGETKDIGNVVRILCSDNAAYMNGAYIPVDGGMLEV